MLRRALTSCAFALFLCRAIAAPDPLVSRMDQIAQYYVGEKQFMGTVLVTRGDQTLFRKSYGSANIATNTPNNPTTKFRIGSITKQFTAACVLLLEERGKLKLDDPIKKFYPDAPASWDKITLFHLLTHTSGIPNLTEFLEFVEFSSKPRTPDELVAFFRDRPLDFEPGAKQSYSNSGYALLGVVIEKASGARYADFLKENVLVPLGLNDTAYDTPRLIPVPNRATGYYLYPSGPQEAPYTQMTVPFAAGALYSTAEDLVRWERGLFGGKLLTPASFQKMTTPAREGYGLGVVIRVREGVKDIEHGGKILGFDSMLAYYPDDQVTVVALSNINGPGAREIVHNIGALVHGQKVDLPNDPLSVAPEILAQLAGTYEIQPGKELVFTVDGHRLMGSANGKNPDPVYADSPSRWHSQDGGTQLEFVRDATGKVTHVLVRKGDKELEAVRKPD